jgi:hypothetical protein
LLQQWRHNPKSTHANSEEERHLIRHSLLSKKHEAFFHSWIYTNHVKLKEL